MKHKTMHHNWQARDEHDPLDEVGAVRAFLLCVALAVLGLFLVLPVVAAGVAGVLSVVGNKEPFELSAFHCCIYSAPVKVPVSARLDPATVRGEVCIFVEGPEIHPSCWNAEELGTPVVRRVFDLHTPGEYLVQMRQMSGNGKRASNVLVLVLN